MTYNPPGQNVYIMAENLSKYFNKILETEAFLRGSNKKSKRAKIEEEEEEEERNSKKKKNSNKNTNKLNSNTTTNKVNGDKTQSSNTAKDKKKKKKDIEPPSIRVAIVGQPNVGKSSLLNCIVKEDRVVVSDIAGTTHDPVDETIEWKGNLPIYIYIPYLPTWDRLWFYENRIE